MCGRFTQTDAFDVLAERFGITVESGTNEELTARYNVAPTQAILIITASAKGRHLVMAKWGFRPAWVNGQQARPDQCEGGNRSPEPLVRRGCEGRALPRAGYRILPVAARPWPETEAALFCQAQGRDTVRVRGTVDASRGRGLTADLCHPSRPMRMSYSRRFTTGCRSSLIPTMRRYG